MAAESLPRAPVSINTTTACGWRMPVTDILIFVKRLFRFSVDASAFPTDRQRNEGLETSADAALLRQYLWNGRSPCSVPFCLAVLEHLWRYDVSSSSGDEPKINGEGGRHPAFAHTL